MRIVAKKCFFFALTKMLDKVSLGFDEFVANEARELKYRNDVSSLLLMY